MNNWTKSYFTFKNTYLTARRLRRQELSFRANWPMIGLKAVYQIAEQWKNQCTAIKYHDSRAILALHRRILESHQG